MGDIQDTTEELNWNTALTKSQRERLGEQAVKSLIDLLTIKEVKDLTQELFIGTATRYGLYLTPQGTLEEHYANISADWEGWTREHRKITVAQNEYIRIVEEYQLTPQYIKELKRRITT